MRVVSFCDARNNLKDVLDTVASDYSITIIHRRDHQDAVVMSLADYNSMADTIHLLSNKANRDHLARSIAQFKAGKLRERKLITEEEEETPDGAKRQVHGGGLEGLPGMDRRQEKPSTAVT